MIRTTFYFAGTGREQSSHDCETILEAFERLQRTGMNAIAFPVGSERGAYVWRPNADNTLAALEARMNELAQVHTLATERAVMAAAIPDIQWKLGHHHISVDFEQHQWWVTCRDCGAQWAVSATNNGFAFEQLTKSQLLVREARDQ